jgi:hypothetical protein
METLAAPHVLPAWVPTALTIAADRISKYRDVQTTLPTRASMVADLQTFCEQAAVMERLLERMQSTWVTGPLRVAIPDLGLEPLLQHLGASRIQAEYWRGKLAGRGRADSLRDLLIAEPRLVCAAIISDISRIVRQQQPDRRNRAAWAACEALWVLSGGERTIRRLPALWERHLAAVHWPAAHETERGSAALVVAEELIFDAGGPKPRSWRHNSA